MEADPPYAAPPGSQCGGVRLSCADAATGVIEVEVRGRWGHQLSGDVHLALRACMSESPLAVIIDLQDLIDVDADSVAMWLAAAQAAKTLRPPARVLICVPPTRQLASRLRRLGAVRFMPLYATMKQARVAAASALPWVSRLHLNPLRPMPDAPTVAGAAVAVACAAWRLPDLLNRSQEIMIELVTDAITHAGTDMALTVSLRGGGLHLAVHDGDGQLPRMPAASTARQGLRTVEFRASAWGAMPARDGKVVWALVRPHPDGSPRARAHQRGDPFE